MNPSEHSDRVLRWQLEVTFREVRAHLGVETQRQWSDLAIARTTPALLGLFSLVTLLTQQRVRRHAPNRLVHQIAADLLGCLGRRATQFVVSFRFTILA